MSDRDEMVKEIIATIARETHGNNSGWFNAENAVDKLSALFAERPLLANALLPSGCYVAVPGGRAVTYRDAGSGRYTTKADAEARPKETVRERSKSKTPRS